jgi:CBS-domain-containing membrane protein
MSKASPAPTAREFMRPHVHTVAPDMPLADVAEFLLKHGVSNAPVVDTQADRTVLIGFISERDCLEHLSNEAFYGSPAMPQTARTVMRLHPVCVAPETDLFTLVSVLVHHGYRHLPVVGEHQELLGIVSRRDVLQALCEYYRAAIQERELERFPPDLTQIINQRFIMRGR